MLVVVLAHGEFVIGPPKSEADRRTVAVPPQAVNALETHLDSWTATGADAWVFTGDKVARFVTPCGTSGTLPGGRLACLPYISMTYATLQQLSRLALAPE